MRSWFGAPPAHHDRRCRCDRSDMCARAERGRPSGFRHRQPRCSCLGGSWGFVAALRLRRQRRCLGLGHGHAAVAGTARAPLEAVSPSCPGGAVVAVGSRLAPRGAATSEATRTTRSAMNRPRLCWLGPAQSRPSSPQRSCSEHGLGCVRHGLAGRGSSASIGSFTATDTAARESRFRGGVLRRS
jgi:hypothetical protein